LSVTLDILEANGLGSAGAAGTAGLPGARTFMLNDGFTINPQGPFVPFVPTASGNYTYTDVQGGTATSASTDIAGQSTNVTSTNLATLVVTVTATADGSWTYQEALTSSYNVQTTPTGGPGTTVTQWGSYTYSFSASGDTSTEAYSFTVSGSDNSSAAPT